MEEKLKTIRLFGGIVAVGVSSDEERVLLARQSFVKKYCADRGWDMLNLSVPQLLEIRNQSDWKHAG